MTPHLTADLVSSLILASAVGLNSVRAHHVGRMPVSSSRAASSVKPRVE
ncbi:hypothetical protein [Streptomyces sulphureus]